MAYKAGVWAAVSACLLVNLLYRYHYLPSILIDKLNDKLAHASFLMFWNGLTITKSASLKSYTSKIISCFKCLTNVSQSCLSPINLIKWPGYCLSSGKDLFWALFTTEVHGNPNRHSIMEAKLAYRKLTRFSAVRALFLCLWLSKARDSTVFCPRAQRRVRVCTQVHCFNC